MKNTTTAIVCASGALIYLLGATPAVLTWYANLDAKHPEMANPITSAEKFASGLITYEAFLGGFFPVFALLIISVVAWRQGDSEPQSPPPAKVPGRLIPVLPGPIVPALGPAWPKAKK